MLVSIVIPCHNRVEDTRACLETLCGQHGNFELEILVVDNGSTDGTAGLASETPFTGTPLRILRQEHNLGFAGGVNRGLEQARGDFLLVLNNDTLAPHNLVQRLLQPLLVDQGIGITAPVSNHVKGVARLKVEENWSRANYQKLEDELSEFASGKIQDSETVAGLCMMFPRTLLEHVGLFDERFGLGNFEDNDYCLRARLLGYRLCVVRDAYLHHHGHRTFQDLDIDYEASIESQMEVFCEAWSHDPAGRTIGAMLRGDLDEAAATAPEGLLLHPAWPEGHLILARWHAVNGRAVPSTHHYRAFLALCPRHTDAFVSLTFQLFEADQTAEAFALVAEFAPCMYFDEKSAARLCYIEARGAERRGDDAEAIQGLERSLELNPDDCHALNLIGAIRVKAGQHAEALASFEKAWQNGDLLALNNIATCQWSLGQRAEAIQSFGQYAMARPGDSIAAHNLKLAMDQLEAEGNDVTGLRRCVDRLLQSAAR